MADATPVGETGTPAAPQTDANPPVTPSTVKTEDPAVVQLRKEKEQAEMRANQLANQLKAKEDADAAAKAAELEEQNQFKSLYEQEKSKREAIEAETEAKEKQAELARTKQEVLSDYSDEVKKEAEDFGFDLADTDEATVASFKEKLEKINTRVVSTGRVTSNNQANTNPNEPELTGDDLKQTLEKEDTFHEYVTKKYPGIAAMTGPRK